MGGGGGDAEIWAVRGEEYTTMAGESVCQGHGQQEEEGEGEGGGRPRRMHQEAKEHRTWRARAGS